MSHKELSVIVPVRENSETFPLALIDIDNYLSKRGGHYEIIVSAFKDNEKVSNFRKKIGSAIANMKFVDSEFGDAVSLSRAGISTAAYEAILWADPDYLFDVPVADLAISRVSAEKAGHHELFFAVPKAIHASDIISEKFMHLFSPLRSEEVSLVAFSRGSADKVCGALNHKAHFALDFAMASEKIGLKVEELSYDLKNVLPKAKKSVASVAFYAALARLKFEARWAREGQRIEVRI